MSRELGRLTVAQRAALESSQVFQGLADPRQTLYLATWQSREAYLAHRAESRVDETLREVGDKLNGLIAVVDRWPRNPA